MTAAQSGVLLGTKAREISAVVRHRFNRIPGRGLLRLWILATPLWVLGWLWYVRATCIDLIPITASESSKQYVKLCYTNFSGLRTPVPDFAFWEYASIGGTAIGVPVAVLLLGVGVLWASEGVGGGSRPMP